MSSTDDNSKSTAVKSPSTSRDGESSQSNNTGYESNPSQYTSQRVVSKVTYSPARHTTSANSERVMPTLSNPVQGTSRPINDVKSSDKPFGQRAKKSFPQPKRLRPVLGRDPNNPDIEVVQYIDKGKSVLEPHLGLKVPHSIKKEVTTGRISSDEELHLTNPHPTSTVNKASPVTEQKDASPESKTEPEDASPVRTPDQSIFSNSLTARDSDQETEKKTSSFYTSYRGTSPTPGPSGVKMGNDEEMNRTVTSTTVGGGSPIDKEHKKSILASMKQAYTSELDQSDRTLPSESESSLNESAGMPTLTANKSLNSSCDGLSDKMPNLKTDDSFDEELISLAEKTRYCFSDSKTDFEGESQEEVDTKRDSSTSTPAPVDLTCQMPNLRPANSGYKPIPDLQAVHHPPTPALTPIIPPLNPLTDDLEAAMAKLHGESLNDDSIDDELPVLGMPMTNTVVTKVVEEPSVSCNPEISSPLNSENQSDSDYCPESDHREADAKSDEQESPIKTCKYRKIGPKSKMETTPVRKPFTLNASAQVASTREARAANSEASDEEKSKPKPAPASKAHSRQSREVEKLCEDEMVQNILRDLEVRGLNKRRSTHTAVTYKEDLFNSSDKDARITRRVIKRSKKNDSSLELDVTPPKKKKMGRLKLVPTPAELAQQQDQALQQWQPVKNSSNEDKVVYVPRKLANPASCSRIVRRRSFSSDSSADGNQNNNRTSQDGTRWYTAIKFSNESETSHDGTEDLVSKLSAKCQEIDISCRDHLLCIKLCPRTSILRNSLNSNILKELSMVLRKLKVEPSIHVILITSSGPDFCNGIDFPFLISDNMGQRLHNAVAVADNLQEFIMELANCDKVVVGGLIGSVTGLGFAMIPYMDFTFASDKTTFCLPYVQLGQCYEGGLSLTLRTMSSNLNNLLLTGCRRLTATQAKDFGLIEDVFLPDDFEKEVVLRACKMAALFSPTSLLNKKMLRVGLRRDLPEVLKEESQLLRQTWISDDFQRRAKQLYADGEMLF